MFVAKINKHKLRLNIGTVFIWILVQTDQTRLCIYSWEQDNAVVGGIHINISFLHKNIR